MSRLLAGMSSREHLIVIYLKMYSTRTKSPKGQHYVSKIYNSQFFNWFNDFSHTNL